MKCFLLAVLLTVAGCAPTRHPEVIPASLAKTSDAMAREALDALARRDSRKLEELGASKGDINAALSSAPQITLPLKIRFATDYLVGSKHYARAYLVGLTGGGELLVLVWFKDPGGIKVERFEFSES